MTNAGTLLEYRVDEAVRLPVDLALGERPQLERLHLSRQGIGHVPEAEDTCGPGQQEPPRARVRIDDLLDRTQELGDPLNLVDDEHRLVTYEVGSNCAA
jgi:hypothetical protein